MPNVDYRMSARDLQGDISPWGLMIRPSASPQFRLPCPLKMSCGVAVAVLALLTLVFLVACGDSGDGPAPDFELTRFDGTGFTLSEQVGRNVVINFWYPTCPPCRAEMPGFQRAWEQLRGEGTRFLGIFVPQGFDTEQDARDFVNSLGLTYAFATDKGARVAQAYQVQYFPVTFFIDKSGRVFEEELSILDEDKIVRIVREMDQD